MKSPDGGRSNMLLVIVRPTSVFFYQLYPMVLRGNGARDQAIRCFCAFRIRVQMYAYSASM